MLNVKWEKGKKQQRSAYSQERNVNWTVTKLSSEMPYNLHVIYVDLQATPKVYLKAMFELINWAPRRAQISLDLCYSQVGLWEFNSKYLISHNEHSDFTEAFLKMSFLQWIVVKFLNC